jgi:hypothetical protein
MAKSGLRRHFPIGWADQRIPFSDKRQDTDCCVIGSGGPRSGTHLLTSIFRYLGKWEHLGVYINPESWEMTRDWHKDQDYALLDHRQCAPRLSVKKLRNGQMAAGHLPWNEPLADTLAKVIPDRRFKHVFMHRDPRDAFVSAMNHNTYIEKYTEPPTPGIMERQRFYRQTFSDDSERLMHLMRQDNYNTHLDYAPWLEDPHAFVISFEDLYTDILGLRDQIVGNHLRGLLDFLEVDGAEIDPVGFYQQVHNKSVTASPEMNKVGQYKKIFDDQHYALLDTPEFRNVLDVFGYEWYRP